MAMKLDQIAIESFLWTPAQVYPDGLKAEGECRRERRFLWDKLEGLVVPGVDAAKEAGKLLEDLPRLWEEANLAEQMELLLAVLDGVYVDTLEEKSVVAMRPKPTFIPIFEVATTREESGIMLINENKLSPATGGQEATNPCLWWRRGKSNGT